MQDSFYSCPSLNPCPDKPNCVSTLDDTKAILVGLLESIPGCEVVVAKEGYVKAFFTSRIFGFKDDVEFYLTIEKKF